MCFYSRGKPTGAAMCQQAKLRAFPAFLDTQTTSKATRLSGLLRHSADLKKKERRESHVYCL